MRGISLLLCILLAEVGSAQRIPGCYCQKKFADGRNRWGAPRCKIHPSDVDMVGSFIPDEPWDPTSDFGENSWYETQSGQVWTNSRKWKCFNITLIPFPSWKLDASNFITLRRGACFGTCPVYTVKVFGNGTVVWQGTRFVKAKGKKISRIPTAKVSELFKAFADGQFGEFKNYTNPEITDAPYYTLSAKLGKTNPTLKIVRHYEGDSTAPLTLTLLEDLVDMVANTSRWIGKKKTIKYNPKEAVVTLTRISDWWKNWPAYTVNITGMGKVTFRGKYNGKSNPKPVVPKATATVSKNRVQDMIINMMAAGFWTQKSFPNKWGECTTDQATANITLRIGKKVHTVTHYFGCNGVPGWIPFLERDIDGVAGVCKYVGKLRTMWWLWC